MAKKLFKIIVCKSCSNPLHSYFIASIIDSKKIIERGLMCLTCGTINKRKAVNESSK